MRRFITALLAMLYMVAGTGFTLRQHYCMGEHIGTALAHPADVSDTHRCDRCGMEKVSGEDNGCCKDQFKTVKAADDQQTVSPFQFEAPALTAVLPQVPVIPQAPDFSPLPARLSATPVHGPPDDSGPLRFLRLRCIRI